MAVINYDPEDQHGWNEEPTELLTDLTGREPRDAIFRRRVERLAAAYYAGVAEEVIALQAAGVIVAVHRSRFAALWVFLEVLGLRVWISVGLFLINALILVMAFLLGMKQGG